MRVCVFECVRVYEGVSVNVMAHLARHIFIWLVTHESSTVWSSAEKHFQSFFERSVAVKQIRRPDISEFFPQKEPLILHVRNNTCTIVSNWPLCGLKFRKMQSGKADSSP